MPKKVLPKDFERVGPTTVRHRPTGAMFWAKPRLSADAHQVDSWLRGNFDDHADHFDLGEIREAAGEALRRLSIDTPNP
jgi:hypothetical protein